MRVVNQLDLEIGRRLRRARVVANLTQNELAEKLGISFQQIQKYENGANRISAARLWSVSRVFGLPVTYFYEGLSDEQIAGQEAYQGPDHHLPDQTLNVARLLDGLRDGEIKDKLFDLIRAISKQA